MIHVKRTESIAKLIPEKGYVKSEKSGGWNTPIKRY